MSNIVVRNINGVKGFCIYKNGQPYTYIYILEMQLNYWD